MAERGPPPGHPSGSRVRVAPLDAEAPRPPRQPGPAWKPPWTARSPEASSRLVQLVMLALSVLLLGVAAVLFVGVITDLEPWSQLVILLAVVGLALAAAPPVATRGLTATAETVAVVGMLVVGIAGYALWRTGWVAGLPGVTFSGLVAGTTALVGYGYHLGTRLELPRWAALLALQPVLPLLAYPLVTGGSGWALVFALVAAHNAGLAAAGGRRPLGYLAWVLHAAAGATAVGWSSAGLITAGTAAAAVTPGLTLLLTTAVGVAGAYGLRQDPLPEVTAGLFTLAVIASAGRVLALALPGRALLPVAAVAAATALATRLLPARARRGPLLAVAVAFAGIGLVVAALAVRAGLAALVLPPWPDSLAVHQQELAAAGTAATGWQLAATAAALTVGAAATVPPVARRESVVVGTVLVGLAAPASFQLGPVAAPWVLTAIAAGVAISGLDAATRQAVVTHIAAGSAAGLVAVGAALASPALTATVLAAITVTGAVVGSARPRHADAGMVTDWTAAAALLALPGAAAAGAVAAGLSGPGVQLAAFAAVCGSLGYTVAVQLRHRFVPVAVRAAAALATMAVAGLTFATPESTWPDRGIAALLAGTGVLVLVAPRLDTVRRPGRLLDGADLAAAALAAGVLAVLARLVTLALPAAGLDAGLAIAAGLVFTVTLAVRALPRGSRRGPVVGVAVAGGVLAAGTGTAAVAAGAQVLAAPGPLWQADLSRWWPPDTAVAGLGWSPPLVLALLAVAAALLFPRTARFRAGSQASAGLAVLAVVAAPVALGLDWWAPAALSAAAGTAYLLSAALPTAADPRAVVARAVAGGLLGLYAVGAALVRPWTTAAVLGGVVLVSAVAAAVLTRGPVAPARIRVGGTAVTVSLLAVPGGLAAFAVHLGRPVDLALLTALAGAALGLALTAVLPHQAVPYLPYGTAGVAAGATGVAFFALPVTPAAGVYAAAAVLLGVLAELLRAARLRSGFQTLVRPAVGALVAAAVPAVIALVTLAPVLYAGLTRPYQALDRIWQGPPAALVSPAPVAPSSVLSALLLTLATALAAVGFGGAVTRQAVPVVAPGLAVTLLISPAALGMPWPAGTVAALAVFTLAVLGVALTPPLPVNRATRPLRITRLAVLGIGLAAGGTGLAGALTDPLLTWATFGGAIAVGGVAAVGARTGWGRLVGWSGAALAAQLFALTTTTLLGTPAAQTGFGLLAVAAVALLVVARLPRLRHPQAGQQLAVVEWLGGYLSLLGALAFAFPSRPDLASTLIAAGAVLGLAALRPGRSHRWRRGLLWAAAGSEVGAWVIIMRTFDVGLLEAYTLPFALFALLVGALEARYRPDLSSWATWGPGLVAALGPSLMLVLLSPEPQPVRQGYVLLGGVATLILGSQLGQRAPLAVGTVVTAIAALHLLSLAGPWLVLLPLGLLLLFLGANREKRERDLARLRGAYYRMR